MSPLGWVVALSIGATATRRAPRPVRLVDETPRSPHPRSTLDRWRHLSGRARLALQRLTGRLEQRRDDQLCLALEHIAASIRSGTTLVAAVAAAATTAPQPIGIELQRVAAAVRGGAPLRSALERWNEVSGVHAGTRLAATALGLAADAGGEMARSVDRVAATLRERREVRAEARALATQARASAAVLVAAPVVFTALVATVEPGAVLFLVGSPLGLSCLVLGLALDAVGALWMTRIVRSPR